MERQKKIGDMIQHKTNAYMTQHKNKKKEKKKKKTIIILLDLIFLMDI